MLTFKLTIDQSNLILNALADQPFKVSAPLIQELNSQAAPQLAQPEIHAADEATS
jgi:hypothetical protein